MRNEIAEILASQLEEFRRRLPEDVFRKTVMESLDKMDEVTPIPAMQVAQTHNDSRKRERKVAINPSVPIKSQSMECPIPSKKEWVRDQLQNLFRSESELQT